MFSCRLQRYSTTNTMKELMVIFLNGWLELQNPCHIYFKKWPFVLTTEIVLPHIFLSYSPHQSALSQQLKLVAFLQISLYVFPLQGNSQWTQWLSLIPVKMRPEGPQYVVLWPFSLSLVLYLLRCECGKGQQCIPPCYHCYLVPRQK